MSAVYLSVNIFHENFAIAAQNSGIVKYKQ